MTYWLCVKATSEISNNLSGGTVGLLQYEEVRVEVPFVAGRPSLIENRFIEYISSIRMTRQSRRKVVRDD